MAFHQANSGVLRGALITNGAFSLLCAAACLIASSAVADTLFSEHVIWFGFPGATTLLVVGAGLGLFGASVLFTGLQRRLNPFMVKVIIAFDLGWVVLSAVALVLASSVLTLLGVWIVVGLAAMVLVFALAQALGLAILYQGESALSVARDGRVRRVKLTRAVDVPKATAWEVMIDHEAYADIAENLASVEIVDGEGHGMCRRCYGSDGSTWMETSHVWEEGERYGFTIDTEAPDYPYPLARLAAVWSVKSLGDTRSVVSIEFEVEPRTSLKGAIFVRVSMLMFPKLLDRLLGRWAVKMDALYEDT